MLDAAFLAAHRRLSRRFFLQSGVAGAGLVSLGTPLNAAEDKPAANAKPAEATKPTEATKPAEPAKPAKPEKAGAKLEPYFTPTAYFRDVSRGKPTPHSLPDHKKREVGLTRETWKLEVLSDPENPAKVMKPMTKEAGTALDFAGLMKLAEKHAVRFPKVMTCLNIGCPLGMGIWEGVPLRTVLWLTEPRENLRRVFYYGYHNDDPAQMFRSSLPVGRVLEDPAGLPPVILCYKLNGQWLDSERGGPVRVVVPEAYGFKSIKWVSHVVLSNLAHANDTYAAQNNDVDSPLKTFSAVLSIPTEVKAGEPIPVSGYAQVGVSGLTKVQVSIASNAEPHPPGDPHYTLAPWRDAELLAPPERWDALEGGKLPAETMGFDAAGRPKQWPLTLAKAHWAAVLPGLPPGEYTFRSRTIDAGGHAQPMPRPFRKSGHAAIESVVVKVKA